MEGLSIFSFKFHALGGPNELQIYATDKSVADDAASKAIELVRAIEVKFSRYRADSIISKINQAAGEGAVEVDTETAALFDYGAELYAQSNGLFDLTSGVLRRVWNFKESKIPSPEELEKLLPLIGWNKVEWRKPYIRLLKKGMELDLGGIGKEYAVDRVAALLNELNIKSALVNLGGDVRVTTSHPSGAPWAIGIANPRAPSTALVCVEVTSGAVATSGDYERFFELDGVRYSHILNPKTGFPVSEFQSVSVFSESCLIAGSASTTAMLLGAKRAKKFLSDLGLPYILVTKTGALEVSRSIKRAKSSARAYRQYLG